MINSSYGLGENIVKGKVTPDQFYVFEPTLKKGFKPIIEKQLGTKEIKLIYASGKESTKDIQVPKDQRKKFSINNNEILQLAKWSSLIENHYKRQMDMEWAKDGIDNKLYILQARPETVQSGKDVNVIEEYVLENTKSKSQSMPSRAVGGPKILVKGLSVGSKIGQGKVRVILDVKDIEKFKKGEVLVTEMTDPDWEPVMKMASAVVTDEGGRTCHSAIVSRSLEFLA